jgi:hypothetical protein
MKTFTKLSLAIILGLASAAAGCAGPGTQGDDTGDDTGGDDMPPGDDDVETTSPVGRYQVASEFDMATGLPGTVGTIVNGFIDATDGADDPGRWLCDLAADQLDGTWGDIAHGACSVAGGYINDRLLDIAPDFVDTLIQLGNDFGQIARNFGLRSELDVTAAGAAYMSTHMTTAINFKLDDVDHVFALTAYGMDNITVENVGVTYDTTGQFTIAAHEIPLAYGSVLRIGLDELLIPALDPFADGLGELLANQVDCYQVGVAIQDAVGFGSISMYQDACEAGLEAGANLVYSQLANLDSTAFKFGIAGAARATDTNGDRKVDEISRGEWTGNLDVAGAQAPLTGAKFTGARM